MWWGMSIGQLCFCLCLCTKTESQTSPPIANFCSSLSLSLSHFQPSCFLLPRRHHLSLTLFITNTQNKHIDTLVFFSSLARYNARRERERERNMTGPSKVDEFQAHPVKDQLPGIDYCLTSSPPWRTHFLSLSFSICLRALLCLLCVLAVVLLDRFLLSFYSQLDLYGLHYAFSYSIVFTLLRGYVFSKQSSSEH